jgi:hypothetical protein
MLMRRTEEMLVIEDLIDSGLRVKTSLDAKKKKKNKKLQDTEHYSSDECKSSLYLTTSIIYT